MAPRNAKANEEAGDSRERAKKQAFGEGLANDARAGSSESFAHAHFAGAGGGFSDEQIRDVNAGEYEEERDKREENRDGGSQTAAQQIFARAGGFDAEVEPGEVVVTAVVGQSVFGGLLEGSVQGGLGTGIGNTRFGAGQQEEPPGAPFVYPVAAGEGIDPGLEGDREIEAPASAELRAERTGREDADDRNGDSIEGDGCSDDAAGLAKVADPEIVAEDGDGGRAVLRVRGKDGAAKNCRGAEHLEEVAGNDSGIGNEGLTIEDSGEGVSIGESGEAVEVFVLRSKALVDGIGERGGAEAARDGGEIAVDGRDGLIGAVELPAEQTQLFGMSDAEFGEEDVFCDGEQSSVGADSEGHGNDGDGGDETVLTEEAKGVVEIGGQVFYDSTHGFERITEEWAMRGEFRQRWHGSISIGCSRANCSRVQSD